MKKINAVLLIVGLLVSGSCFAVDGYDQPIDCDHLEKANIEAKGRCSMLDTRKSTARMDKAYKRLLQTTTDENTKNTLIAAQGAWREYADKKCISEVWLSDIPIYDKQYNAPYTMCLMSENDIRTKYLTESILSFRR